MNVEFPFLVVPKNKDNEEISQSKICEMFKIFENKFDKLLKKWRKYSDVHKIQERDDWKTEKKKYKNLAKKKLKIKRREYMEQHQKNKYEKKQKFIEMLKKDEDAQDLEKMFSSLDLCFLEEKQIQNLFEKELLKFIPVDTYKSKQEGLNDYKFEIPNRLNFENKIIIEFDFDIDQILYKFEQSPSTPGVNKIIAILENGFDHLHGWKDVSPNYLKFFIPAIESNQLEKDEKTEFVVEASKFVYFDDLFVCVEVDFSKKTESSFLKTGVYYVPVVYNCKKLGELEFNNLKKEIQTSSNQLKNFYNTLKNLKEKDALDQAEIKEIEIKCTIKI